MAKSYSIETVFKLIDQVSAPTSKISKALDKMGIKSKTVSNALKRDFDKAAARIDKLGASIKKWAGRAVLGGIAAIGVGIGVAAKQFIEFDDALHKAGSIFSDLNPLADDFKTRLDAIGKAARDVAAKTEFNAEQTASALATMAMAGIKSSQAISLLPRVADMATAAGVDLDQAVGMAADSLNVFGKMTDDPLKLAENFQYVSDIMVKTANLANMDISMMYEAIGAGGSEFKKANQRIEDFGAAVDILAANSIKGSEAGKAISTMMVRLAAPAKAGEDALKALGIRTQDAQGNMLNFVDIIGQLNVAFKGLGTAQQADYIDALFGKNRYAAASALINAGVEGFRTYSRELENAAGSTAQVAEVMRQSIKNKLAVLGSAATEMGFKFVEAFKDKAVTAIESATAAIENFDVTPLVEMASAAADGIMKFAGVIAGAVKTAWQFRYVIVAIAAPIAAYNILLMAATVGIGLFSKLSLIGTIVMGTQTTALAMLKKGTIEYLLVDKLFLAATKIKTILLMVLTKGTLTQSGALAAMAVANKTATVSQWLLNAAMNANPIGLVVLAIAVLIGIIAALVKWGHKAATVFIIIAGVLLGPVAAAVGFIISAFVELIKGWGSVTKAFKDGGIIAGFKQIGALLLSGILGPIQGLLELLAKIPGVGKLLEPAVKGLNDFRNKLKGIEAPVIEAEVKTPETEFDKLTKEFGIAMPEMPDMDYPGFGIPGMGSVPGTGERSKLHGVVDISGGVFPASDGESAYTTTSAVGSASSPGTATAALTSYVISIAATLQRIDTSVSAIARGLPPAARAELPAIAAPEIAARNVMNIPMLPVSGKGPQTADTAASTPPPQIPAIPPALTSNVISIAATLQRIDASVSVISRGLPPAARAELPAITAPVTATRMSPALPRINMGGDDGGDYYNPREISPVTQAERMAYSLEERRQTVVIEVAAEKGTAARVVRAPRDVDIQLVTSGGNA